MPVATVPTLPSFAELESAAELVHRFVPPTPQYSWPLLNQRAGCEVWMKHENHTPVGAFKVRGGIGYGWPGRCPKRARAENQDHRRGVSKCADLCVIVCGRARGGAEVRDAHC